MCMLLQMLEGLTCEPMPVLINKLQKALAFPVKAFPSVQPGPRNVPAKPCSGVVPLICCNFAVTSSSLLYITVHDIIFVCSSADVLIRPFVMSNWRRCSYRKYWASMHKLNFACTVYVAGEHSPCRVRNLQQKLQHPTKDIAREGMSRPTRRKPSIRCLDADVRAEARWL